MRTRGGDRVSGRPIAGRYELLERFGNGDRAVAVINAISDAN